MSGTSKTRREDIKEPNLWFINLWNTQQYQVERYLAMSIYWHPISVLFKTVRSCGPMDKASDYESGDCRFESCQDQIFLILAKVLIIEI